MKYKSDNSASLSVKKNTNQNQKRRNGLNIFSSVNIMNEKSDFGWVDMLFFQTHMYYCINTVMRVFDLGQSTTRHCYCQINI